MGGVKIPGPPSLLQKKLPFVEITEYTANRVKVQHFSGIKNYEKIVLFLPQIMGGGENPRTPPSLSQITTLRGNNRKYHDSRKSTALFPH